MQGPPASYLPDVLDQLPLDVVDTNVWQLLKEQPMAARRSLRQACHQTRRLVDSLVTALALVDTEPAKAAGTQAVAPLTDERQEAWHQAAEQRAAFLGRLPRLTSLQLTRWSHEPALAELLTRYGAATQGRITKLTLNGGDIGIAALSALLHACPRLTALHVTANRLVTGDVLLPLTHIPTLTSLTVDTFSTVLSGPPVLRSLGAVTSLRHLELRTQGLRHEQLRLLSRLVSLRHLRVFSPGTATSLVDVSSLFALSHLTRLELPNVACCSGDGGAGAVAVVAGVAPPAAVSGEGAARAAVVALGHLRQLQHLCFSSAFVVDDGVFPALRQLTRLTTLTVARIQLTDPQPGHLPALQRLIISEATLWPSQLLHSLLPLLPLAALTHLCNGSHSLKLAAGGHRGYLADAEGAALRRVALHLSAAATLTLTAVSLDCGDEWENPGAHLSCRQVSEGLQPLSSRLVRLTLLNWPAIGSEYAFLGSCLPSLPRVSLVLCALTDTSLSALASRWSALATLCVRLCRGVTVEGWLALAGAHGGHTRSRCM